MQKAIEMNDVTTCFSIIAGVFSLEKQMLDSVIVNVTRSLKSKCDLVNISLTFLSLKPMTFLTLR